jgi:hypothetical protein
MDVEGTIKWKYDGAKEWVVGPEFEQATMLPDAVDPHVIRITFEPEGGSRFKATMTLERKSPSDEWLGPWIGDERKSALVTFNRQISKGEGTWTFAGRFTGTETPRDGTPTTYSGICEMELYVD